MEPPAGWKPESPGDDDLAQKPVAYMPTAEQTATALRVSFDGIDRSSTRLHLAGIENLARLDDAVLKDSKVMSLLIEMIGQRRGFQSSTNQSAFDERLRQLFFESVLADPQDPESSPAFEVSGVLLHQAAPYFWRHNELYHRSQQSMIDFSAALSDVSASASSTWARSGLQTFARYRGGHRYFNDEADIPRLKSIQGKAALEMKLIDIPVPASHVAYPIYKSQAEFAIGNEDSARELYDQNIEQLLPVHRDLSVPYLLWVLQRTIDGRDEQQQEALVKALLQWAEESTAAFSAEQRLALEIAYGDIAMQRGMLPEAHRIYLGIQKNEAYAAVFARHTATLRRVSVERISKDFDAALATLLELEAEKIPQLLTAAHHARAEVYYDMEEYEDAAEEIAMVLERDATHSDATILRGRVQLKLQRLIEATELELGSVTDQASLVPGEMLKVTLNDPTLSVSSGGTEIEVVVWTTSGDREHLLLRQFGDEKTKYRGEVRTELGKPNEGDRTLQVIGDDKIYYGYSDAFRAKMTNLDESRGGPIIVASDGMLMASARKLLSENEQRVADMQTVTEALSRHGQTDLANTSPELVAELKAEAARAARERDLQARIKPGNPIHIRVIDADRGRTAEIDELPVALIASSGDTLGEMMLKETATHSGRFEGSVPTSRAQAMAFGTSSETGRNPNMVISPKQGYEAWRPTPQSNSDHVFMVDLNDKVDLGSLQIVGSDQGFGLTSFVVQTAMNAGQWTTVARSKADLHPVPKEEGLPASVAIKQPWQSSIVIMNDTDRFQMGGRPTINAFQELENHLEKDWLKQTFPQGIARNVAGPSAALPEDVSQTINWKRHRQHDCSSIVYRFRGWFYEPANVVRRFRLSLGKHVMPEKTHPSLTALPRYMLVVDGRPITLTENPEDEVIQLSGGKLEGKINLRAGLHRFEIYGIGWSKTSFGFGRDIKLEANLEDEDALTDCPDSFFDPKSFPTDLIEPRNPPAKITANELGTEFSVDFAEGSQARLLRIIFTTHQGPVPSLNRLALRTPDGKSVLPVPRDFAELRKNRTLEILSGDRVTVRYLDDRYVTKGKQKHERFLNVNYSDGRIEFADVEPRYSSRHGKKMPYYERLLRFQYGKPYSVVIRDADLDSTVEPDRATFTAIDSSGGERTFVAMETGPSTGLFRALITPVAEPTDDADKVYVRKGNELTVSYLDEENDRPGVPYQRTMTCPAATFQTPSIELAHMAVTRPAEGINEATEELYANFTPILAGRSTTTREQAIRERIHARYVIQQTFYDQANAPEDGIEVVHGRLALIDVVAPHLALSQNAVVDVFVQTDAGRKQSSVTVENPFDVNAPGTLRLEATLGAAPRVQPGLLRAGYVIGGTAGKTLSQATSSEQRTMEHAQSGRFRVQVPLIAGDLPELSFVDQERIASLKMKLPNGLIVRTGERIHVGVRYRDQAGKTQWSTASAKVITHPMLDVMNEGYQRPLAEAFVGEKLYLRAIDLAADRTDGRDTLYGYIASKAGRKHYVQLRETDTHTGIFKGAVQLSYASEGAVAKDIPSTEENQDAYDVRRLGFPVIYGDTVGVRYTDALGRKTPAQYVTVGKGSDGFIAPFSKQYEDAAVAMETQFAMAESYLELARRHRKTGEEEQAAREFTRAKQLLSNAVASFHDPETRAHAEYLLGGLTQEDAQATDDPELQRQRYQAALARFMTITGSYPDTEYASKAQFKIALIYEALKEPEIAAQEYVKLAYKYPESEHLATAMAQLGTHFQRKAVGYERQAAPLLAQLESNPDDKDAEHEGMALQKLSQLEYVKAAQIFERLQTRFPSHSLAGKAGLRAGQIYMRANEFEDAVKALMRVVNDESYDGPTLRSEAMYWAARSHDARNDAFAAYGLYKRITYDFPESKWAAYARAQLSTERLLNLDRDLEIKRLQEGEE